MKTKSRLTIATLFVVALSFLSLSSFAQTKAETQDTVQTKGLFYRPVRKASPFMSQFALASTNFWRGVDIGRQACAKLQAEYEPIDWFTVGLDAIVVSNQYKIGYGNQLNTRVAFNYMNTSFGVQDVYFNTTEIIPNDTAYFVYNKAETQHVMEAFFKYKGDSKSKIDFSAFYAFYENENNPKGACYLEAAYHLDYNARLFVGYVTKPSTVNFQSQAGFTNIGIDITRSLDFSSKFRAITRLTVSVNPSYKTIIAPNNTISTKPLNAVLNVSF